MRQLQKCIVPAAVCLGVLAAAIYLKLSIIGEQAPEGTPEARTQRTLGIVQIAVSEWEQEHDRALPGQTIEEIEAHIAPRVRLYNAKLNAHVPFDRHERILDAWGQSLRLRWLGANNRCPLVAAVGRPLLYSCGANGRDEGGRGDDIVWLLTLRGK
jgi:hypothetical protein